MSDRQPEPLQIRRQRLRLAVVAVLSGCLGFALAAICAASALWQMLFGR